MENNDNISHDLYEKYLSKTKKRPYAVRFKWIRIIMWLSSIFGNFGSIFFAFFFFVSLFSSSFVNIKGLGVNIAIVTALALFELLKRYVFDLFSLEYIKNSKTLFKKEMITFLLSTIILIGFSFFFSMNGAKRFMNKTKEIEIQRNENLKAKTDSINFYYNNEYIKPLKEENKGYNEQISKLSEQVKSWNAKEFNSMITNLNENVQTNLERIKKYENQRDLDSETFKQEYIETYQKQKSDNKWNIIWFLLISATIEILILSGVYFNRHYEDATIKEYEKNVVNTPNFKKWKKSKEILEMIYETGVSLDEPIASTNQILELIEIKGNSIAKTDVENSFKIFSHLNIYQRYGNKRILKMESKDSFPLLKKHFKIK